MIRVCPERDAVCPYGIKCPFVKDRYSCLDGWNMKKEEKDEIRHRGSSLSDCWARDSEGKVVL